MVGEGVLLECLANPQITEVLSVSRKPIGVKHPRLKEYIVEDFLLLQKDDEMLKGYDACFFCAGISSIGMKEAEFKRITYDTTITFANALSLMPQISFIYVSGAGTDSKEKGRSMWARVKGKTENDLMKLPFKQVFAFRPGLMKFTKGQKNISKSQKVLTALYPVFKALFPNGTSTLQQVAKAMIYATQKGYKKNVVEVKDIKILADRATGQNK